MIALALRPFGPNRGCSAVACARSARRDRSSVDSLPFSISFVMNPITSERAAIPATSAASASNSFVSIDSSGAGWCGNRQPRGARRVGQPAAGRLLPFLVALPACDGTLRPESIPLLVALVALVAALVMLRGCVLCALTRIVSRDRRLDDALPNLGELVVYPRNGGFRAVATIRAGGVHRDVVADASSVEGAIDELRRKAGA